MAKDLPENTKVWLDTLLKERDKDTTKNKDVVSVAFQLLNAKQTQEAIYGSLHDFFDRFHLGGMVKKDTFKFDMEGKSYSRPDTASVEWYLHNGEGQEGAQIADYLLQGIKSRKNIQN